MHRQNSSDRAVLDALEALRNRREDGVEPALLQIGNRPLGALIFGLLLWRGVRTSLLAPDRFGKLLALGIVTGIVAQALFNISVALSLVPTKGIPLPFLSYGGSSLVVNMIGTGMLISVSRDRPPI